MSIARSLLTVSLATLCSSIALAQRSDVPFRGGIPVAPSGLADKPLDIRDRLVLITILVTFTIFIVGVMRYGWDFDQMSALFFIMGVVVGLIGRLGVNRTADAFVEGFRSMAFAAMLIGFARAIYVVAEQGHIIDTIVNGLFAPLSHFPVGVAALGMMVTQFLVHFPVPSVTGHAVLTLPVLVPLSDLLGLPRQVTVLIYQYGGGLCNIVAPTNGGLMAILAAANKVVIVPGYGMAVSQAQHKVRELYDALSKRGVDVKFGIHPVAGRMPGHMNVLLAEADIPYDKLLDMDEINGDFQQTDVALIIGANDVTNPAARSDTSSPIYGMPILDVDKARTVMVIKRGMSAGFAGIENPLYYLDRTLMLFGDAKGFVGNIVRELTGGGH